MVPNFGPMGLQNAAIKQALAKKAKAAMYKTNKNFATMTRSEKARAVQMAIQSPAKLAKTIKAAAKLVTAARAGNPSAVQRIRQVHSSALERPGYAPPAVAMSILQETARAMPDAAQQLTKQSPPYAPPPSSGGYDYGGGGGGGGGGYEEEEYYEEYQEPSPEYEESDDGYYADDEGNTYDESYEEGDYEDRVSGWFYNKGYRNNVNAASMDKGNPLHVLRGLYTKGMGRSTGGAKDLWSLGKKLLGL